MSTDPRDVPGWTQQREPPDDSECILLRKMEGDGYILTEMEMNDIFKRLGGPEHIEMIESLERRGFCVAEDDGTGMEDAATITWKLTDQGKKALENA